MFSEYNKDFPIRYTIRADSDKEIFDRVDSIRGYTDEVLEDPSILYEHIDEGHGMEAMELVRRSSSGDVSSKPILVPRKGLFILYTETDNRPLLPYSPDRDYSGVSFEVTRKDSFYRLEDPHGKDIVLNLAAYLEERNLYVAIHTARYYTYEASLNNICRNNLIKLGVSSKDISRWLPDPVIGASIVASTCEAITHSPVVSYDTRTRHELAFEFAYRSITNNTIRLKILDFVLDDINKHRALKKLETSSFVVMETPRT